MAEAPTKADPPAERKRPSVRRRAAPGAAAPAGGSGAASSARPSPAKKAGGSDGGLLASLLGDIEATHKSLGDQKPTKQKDLVGGTAEAAYKQRTEFVADVERQLKEGLLNNPDPDACKQFPPMEKRWRDLIHETAADLKLVSSTVGDDEERCVLVARTPEALGLDMRGHGGPAPAVAVAVARERKKEVLSDLAPTAVAALGESAFAKLNTNKRDLRTIEQIQTDMKTGTKRARSD